MQREWILVIHCAERVMDHSHPRLPAQTVDNNNPHIHKNSPTFQFWSCLSFLGDPKFQSLLPIRWWTQSSTWRMDDFCSSFWEQREYCIVGASFPSANCRLWGPFRVPCSSFAAGCLRWVVISATLGPKTKNRNRRNPGSCPIHHPQRKACCCLLLMPFAFCVVREPQKHLRIYQKGVFMQEDFSLQQNWLDCLKDCWLFVTWLIACWMNAWSSECCSQMEQQLQVSEYHLTEWRFWMVLVNY